MALIVVHTELPYTNPDQVGSKEAEQNEVLFRRISSEIGRRRNNGERVYYVAETQSLSPVHDSVKPHLPYMAAVAEGSTSANFLYLKYALLADGVKKADIVGVSYESCVTMLDDLLASEDQIRVNLRVFESARKELGWKQGMFKLVVSSMLTTRVLHEFTDAYNISQLN